MEASTEVFRQRRKAMRATVRVRTGSVGLSVAWLLGSVVLLVLLAGGCGALPRAAVEERLKNGAGRVAVSIGDSTDEGSWDIRGGEAFAAGDSISLFVLAELLARADAGDVSLDERLPLILEERQEGASPTDRQVILRGPTSFLTSVKEISLRDLALLMMSEGDVRATNLLLDRLGLANVNARAQALGAVRTLVARKLGHTSPPENYTCARDLVAVWRVLTDPEAPWPGVREAAADLLRLSRSADRSLSVGLAASDLRVSYDGDSPSRGALVHCSGVLYLPGRQMAVAMMGEGFDSTRAGEDLIEDISRILHAYYDEEARRGHR